MKPALLICHHAWQTPVERGPGPVVKPARQEVVSVDWHTELTTAAARIGAVKAVQGNMDPCALFLAQAELSREVTRVLDMGRKAKGHIFNLGHGILKETNPDALAVVVETVHEWSPRSD